MPRLGKNEYLRIGQVAQRLGVSASAVRNYTALGLLPAVRNPLNKYRLYREQDVAHLVNRFKNAEKEAGYDV